MIKLAKIQHRGETRIQVLFEKNRTLIAKIKSIEGRQWSQTKRCWHLPYSKAAFKKLKAVFGEENLVYEKKESENHKIHVFPEHDYRVKVLVPPQQKDWIQKIKSLPDRAWNREKKYWSVPKTEEVLKDLRFHFGKDLIVDREITWQQSPSQKDFNKVFTKATPSLLRELRQKATSSDNTFFVTGEQLVVEKINNTTLKLWVPFDKKGWIKCVKNIPGRRWNTENKYWTVPYVKDSLSLLQKYVGNSFLKFKFELSDNIPQSRDAGKPKVLPTPKYQLNQFQQNAITSLEEKLLQKRYSWRTVKSYRNHLIKLFLFYPN
ncbi:MAG: hypothetical protein AAF573_14295, partial [Bacteroidota bacterium]